MCAGVRHDAVEIVDVALEGLPPVPELSPPTDTPPRKLYVEITADCDLDCAMCPRHTWNEPGGPMPAETFSAIIRQLADLPSVERVNLGGYGEPTAHPLFFDFVRQAKDASLAVEAVTNATHLDHDGCERLIDLQLDRLVISVDGVTESASEMLHPGSFEQVASLLRRMHQRKLTRQSALPVTTVEFVATKRNIHELPKLHDLARTLGFHEILVTNLIPATEEQARQTLYDHHGVVSRRRPTSRYSPVVDLPQFDAAGTVGETVARLRRTGTHLRLTGADIAGAGPHCRFIAEGRLAVCWDGRVSPCLSLMHTHSYYFRGRQRQVRAYHVGNVLKASLADIWRSDEYCDFRRRVRDFEFSPCIDCGACDLRDANEADCTDGEAFPRCGECLWAAGLIQCP